MKVLVTGAAGRVGANVVRRLVGTGVDVRAMVMPGDPLAGKLDAFPGIEVIEANLRDQGSIDGAVKGVTHVIHLAAQMGRGQSRVDEYWDVNAFGTLRLLEGVVHAGGVERFVLASTDGTYRPGDPPAVPLTEDVKQEPADYYGTGKLLGEIILRNHSAQFDIPYSIVRFGTVVSPEEAPHVFRISTMRAMLAWQKIGKESHIWPLFRGQPDLLEIFDATVGDAPDDAAVAFIGPEGPWTLHMGDVRDIAQGVHRALTEPGALGRAFNIVGPEPTSHEDGAAITADVFGVPQFTVELPLTWRLEMSIEAAKKHLGFQPKYNYRAMVETANATDLSDDDAYIPAGSKTGLASVI